ncbi:MAG TPA: RHS repeat-associated core domain-containing protein, partial [Longimicrobium sp.]|nr:RHS repeat-associated core domain-containing protein [Longimicrobium sp.]
GTFEDGTITRGTLELAKLDWSGVNTSAYFAEISPTQPERWFGSLIGGMRDGSGQLYRRNRYLDPGSGRFTQEDPIGLAGGMNLYGFVGGDPVTYSDPSGLDVCITGSKQERRQLRRQLEHIARARIRLDDNGCISSVQARSRSGSDHVELEKLVTANEVLWLRFGAGGSRFDSRLGLSITIDREDVGARYFVEDWAGTCAKNGRFTLPQIIAHELGHAYRYSQGLQYTSVSQSETEGGVYYENLYLARERRGLRCWY